jgi:type I restriction enzyme S subunit
MWRERPLGNLAAINSGGTPATDRAEFWGGDIPWVTPTDITACKTNYLFDTANRITKIGLHSCSAKFLPAGSILFTSRATVGVSRIAGIPVSTNQGFKSLTPLAGTDGKFLFYQVQRLRGAFERYAAGSTFPEINKKDTARVSIPHPVDVSVQQKIATILTTIDTAIEKTEALIEKYQQIKAGLMHDLFTRGVLPNGQLRPPREQAPELYQKTAIGWMPKEWKWMPIGELFEIQLGKMLNQLAKTGKSAYPYLGNRSVQWNKIQIENLERMDFSAAEREKFSLKPDDLLVCEGGDVGRTAIWEGQVENCFFQKAIHRLRSKSEAVKPRYMLRYMWFAKQRGLFSEFTSQSSIAHLTQEKLAIVPIAIPTVPEQARLVSQFERIDGLLDAESEYVQKLRTSKLGLMQDLLTGKVEVKVEQDSVEAVNA